ncbi:hypothetical protein CVO77_00315 [Sphingopyxis lindanitolerans]|uniref:Uncharacterized protein n=1 Tax=Sphingopyxis lindanitolerans TaxID=2054227 RepID=A0A2S8BAN5_9SPHN|nr:hypothetical protein [Sphingopyxis lindanitolerans]PQM29417.1 hypothetical protein CVO77_00315 [Sphingopyxis lindanitolerans]
MSIPSDYDPAIPLRQATEIYGVSRGTLGKWRQEVGYKGTPGALAPWTDIEDQQLRANFNTLTYDQLAALIGRSACAIRSRAVAMGMRKASTQFQPDRRAKFEGQRAKGYADLAAEYVRCHDRVAIFRCDADGTPNPKGQCWRYGHAVLTEGELFAKAERKGWRADAWKELAA